MKTDIAVAFFIFNRPLQTARVFSRIALAKPGKLFVVADGPRDSADEQACEAARSVVADVDWPCEVVRDFSNLHLGRRRRMSGGIDSVFAQVEQAIILQDDCLPDPTFFPYCRKLLHRYRDDDRVMTISGDNFQFGAIRPRHSYYFSTVHHLWGWATWRRAWACHDATMSQWPAVADTDFPGDLLPPYAAHYHKRLMAQTYAGELDAWSYEWIFACWLRRGLCALPATNLVSNIGFNAAVQNKIPDACSALPTRAMRFPLIHPPADDLGCRRAA